VTAIDDDSQQLLSDTISAYFREREGRGYSCTVEHYRRGDRLYWFVYPEDYADTSIEYSEEGDFERRSRRPAFEIIYEV
jgi:hypothetical protein